MSSIRSDDDDRLLIHWPMTIAHRIDKDSPFWKMGPKEVFSAKFEMVVTLEGIVESSGNTVQIRSSYLPNEVLWAHRFVNMVRYSEKRGTYVVDLSVLNRVEKDQYTPNKSAR